MARAWLRGTARLSSGGRDGVARALLGGGWLALVLLLTGCAAISTRGDRRRLDALIAAGRAQQLAVVDPLELEPAVAQRVLQQVSREGTEVERLQRLNRWLREPSGLGFRYDARHTRTAAQAWAERSGDCLSYAHLFNALARLLRVPVNYVRFREARTYEERDGQFLVVSHVASLHSDLRVTVLVELTGQAPGSRVSDYELLGDDEAAALHHSNLAMEQLAAGDTATSERMLRLLVQWTPALPELHANLGAVLLRQGRAKEALAVIEQALLRFPDFMPLYVNGALAARGAGDDARSDQLAEQARASWRDPFLPFVRGTWLLDRGEPLEAVKALRRAVALKPGSGMFRAWLTKALIAAGQLDEAREELAWTRRLSPAHPLLEQLERALK